METKHKICPSCKKQFECLHSKNCWCMKYSINDENRAYISLHYDDCLCESCLSKFAELQIKQE